MMTGMDAGLYETINRDMAPPLVREITRRAGYLGDGSSTLGICLALSARDPGTARLGARAVIYSSLLTGMIKFSLGRARPVRGLGPAHYAGPFALSPGFDSMPSGHSAAAFALAGVLARQYPKYRRWFWGLAGLAAISRVYQGAHWPSDVFVGSAIGILAAETVMREGVTYENAACEHFGSLVEGQALTSNLPCDSMKLIE
ncbi:MAG TPA: phosphatase PAP2 family protein [Firmicutes bacterium]|nr:phosphatase PAP2 family protein [Bacillota bacterium]